MGVGELADTIVALSSGRPPAAVAIIRSSGPQAFAAAEQIAGPLPKARYAVLRQLKEPVSGDHLDEALILRFDAGASATGEDIVEYQCHGGRATVDAVLRALIAIDGVRAAEPGEFTRRALASGRIDLTEAEGLADLLMAETEQQRRSALARAGGALRTLLDGWREQLLALSASAEVAIDYADEEDGRSGNFPSDRLASLASDIGALLAAPRVEPLRDGVRAVIAGPPNAGKSSLINAIARSDRAIVTPVAGTTRDVIEVPLAIAGVPFVLADTAGIRVSEDEVETIGIERARQEIERADILVWLGPPHEIPVHPSVIIVQSKADLWSEVSPRVDIAVSTVTGQGIGELLAALQAKARAILPSGDDLAVDRRQHDLLALAHQALVRAGEIPDPLLIAEELRVARMAIDRISGRAGVEELLDALFGRFCLGK
jgi:tRNA modification GTPase